jgi:hypothetical protein
MQNTVLVHSIAFSLKYSKPKNCNTVPFDEQYKKYN